MATATTLEGFLEGDEDNLTVRLTNMIALLGSEGPWEVRVYGIPAGTAVRDQMMDLSLADIAAEGIGNLIEMIRATVINQWGLAPSGKLNVRIYRKGNSANRDLDVTRTIRSVEGLMMDGGNVNVAILQAQIARQEARITQLLNKLMETHTNTTGSLNTALEQITTLSTARTVGTVAADTSGWNIVAALGLLAALPYARRVLEIPRHVTAGRILRKFSQIADQGLPPGGPPRDIYEAGSTLRSEPLGEVVELPDPDEVVQSLRSEPAVTLRAIAEFTEALQRRIATDPELVQELLKHPEGRQFLKQ